MLFKLNTRISLKITRYVNILMLTAGILVNWPCSIQAQTSQIDWAFVLDGYNSVFLADVVVDNEGNTYAAVNYSERLTVPGLNKKLANPGYLAGLIVKINKNGKPLWAHPFESKYSNGIQKLSVANNGDLLIIGYGDDNMRFPGKKDTLTLGKGNVVYAACYSPKGDRKWVQAFHSRYGEGMSIVDNNKNEVWMTFIHHRIISLNEMILEDSSEHTRFYYRVSLVKLDANGAFISHQLLDFENIEDKFSSSAHIKFDKQGNYILYGYFRGKIKFTDKDSLINERRYETTDSYIAKFNANGEFLWKKKMGGRHYQLIQDVAIAADNSIYAIGAYYYECILSSDLSVMQHQSEYEWKSGTSAFYFHLFENGETDFIRFIDNKGYQKSVRGNALGISTNGYVHLVGDFYDTFRMNNKVLSATSNQTQGYYSVWDGSSMQNMDKVGQSKGFFHASRFSLNQDFFAGAGDYVEGISLQAKNKKVTLTNNDYGRSVCIYGGKLVEQEKRNLTSVNELVILEERKTHIEELLACSSPSENDLPHNWFLNPNDSLSLDEYSNTNSKSDNPCGKEYAEMSAILFPNPAIRELTIQFKGIDGAVRLDVLNASGALVFSHQILDLQGENFINLQLQSLAPGTYYVWIHHLHFHKALRFVKLNE